MTDISLLYQRQNANYSYQSDDYDRSTSTTPSFGTGFTAKAEDQMFAVKNKLDSHRELRGKSQRTS